MKFLSFLTFLFIFSFELVKAKNHECVAASLQEALPKRWNATVLSANHVEQNGTYGQGSIDIAYPINPTGLKELCAVLVNVNSSSTSHYTFGLFLPTEWNGRFLATGNGAFAGGINWLDMGAGVGYGFAVMSTDTGHNSTGIDGSWALNAPEVLNDWGYRAMHGSTVLSKKLVNHFYGQPSHHNYYSGCSTGGRQGLRAVQLYPDDYDGVVAGSPAWWTSHLQTWTVKLGAYNLPTNSSHYIPPAQFSLIASEVIRQCDTVDGVQDNIISDPPSCHFNARKLMCKESTINKTECLTKPQIETLGKIYDSYTVDGNYVFPGLAHGSELQWPVLLSGIGNAPNPLGVDYVRYFLDHPDFEYTQFNYSFVEEADRKQPGNATAYQYDMNSFKHRGGKLLMTHGWSDALISTGSSIYFYNKVVEAMNSKVDDWYRFFLIPGMQHCSGTPNGTEAPWYIAAPNQASVLSNSTHGVPGFRNPKHDILLAVVDWVEKGRVPHEIVATYYINDTVANGVGKQRPLCPYPHKAVYDQRGDVNQAKSWKCSAR